VGTRSDGATFAHDPRNRLVQFSKAGTIATYVHDYFGRRIKKVVNSAATWYLWDGTRLMAEYSSSGVRQQRYAYLGSNYVPAQVADANGSYYLHGDHLDTPRLLTDSASQVVWRARYESFGKAVVDSDPDGNSVAIALNFRFPGQYFDAESGLHYNLHRSYDPAIGRFVEEDPLGLSGDENLYAYAGSEPTKFIDPFGLQRMPIENFSTTTSRGEYVPRWMRNDRPPWLNESREGLPRPPPGPYPPGFRETLHRDVDYLADLAFKVGEELGPWMKDRRVWKEMQKWMRDNPPPERDPYKCNADDDKRMQDYLDRFRWQRDILNREWKWAPDR